MNRLRSYLIRCLVFGCLVFGMFGLSLPGCSPPQEPDKIPIAQALSAPGAGDCFQRATTPGAIEFPRDLGPHDMFQTEWWYYTGNLKTSSGRHFGYQLTFFRRALSCEPVTGDSQWRTRQMYFAHFAVTDTQDNAFYSDQRMNRQSLGIAGAQSRPYGVWIDDWQAKQANGGLVLLARGEKTRIRLHLTASKPPILQGVQGLSPKGPEKSNASHYYSLPRLETQGVLEIGPNRYTVRGHSWFDHEWSTQALDTDVAGWDWFSVHLDNGQDLMVCQIRKADGTPNGYGFGSISFPDNTHKILGPDDFSLHTQEYWTSPATGRRYPGKWTLTLPGLGLSLAILPVIQNQEHTHMLTYWEGAARFEGKGIRGLGYVELTGY